MKPHLQKLLFLIIGLSLAATVSYLNAWTEPTQTAPEGNVAAPINVGGDPSGLPQVKTGNIEANSLSAVGMIANQFCIGSDCITAWPSGGSSVPAGTVAAFNLTTCPAGWIPADGMNNTRDLRGVFVRGMESFDAGITSTTTDPDRSGSATLGSYQGDIFGKHKHSGYAAQYIFQSYGGNGGPYALQSDGSWVGMSEEGGNETRPDNVALLFCQKDNSSSGGGSGSSSGSILSSGDSNTNTRYNEYIINLTTPGRLLMSNSYCGNNTGSQIVDAKIYIDGELIGHSRAGNECGWYADCPTIASTHAQKTLTTGEHTLKSECYVPAGSGIIHKSSYTVWSI